MYANKYSRGPIKCLAFSILALGLGVLSAITASVAIAQPSVIRNITSKTERLELMVNSSRIITLEKPIPRMVVNNPEMLTVTALGPNKVQIAAKKTGITQINFWDEDGSLFTVDIVVYGDVQELQHALNRLFPHSSVKAILLSNSLVLEGFVERPEAVGPIVRLAEDYAPKIVNNITVGGVQQVMLKVKVMEVSRTKLRKLGVDWAQISGNNIVVSSVSELIDTVAIGTAQGSSTTHLGTGGTFTFGVLEGNDAFAGFIDALQQNNVAKILADPTIVAISGRPAEFLVGGEFPIIVPSGLGQSTIEYKDFGTKIDFVPIVLGNGNIRLEVRPRVSEIDDTRSVILNSFSVPALRVRKVDTAVEMKAGQTLALAGLIQTRVDSVSRGLPFLSDLPYIGAAFRSVEEEVNEIELLIMVTPELVTGLEPHEVPPCGPGMESVSPSHSQLYFNGHLEMPSCGPCGPNCQGSCGNGCNAGCAAGSNYPAGLAPQGLPVMATDSAAGDPSLGTEQPSLQMSIPQPTEPVLPPANDGSGTRLPAPQAGPVIPSPSGQRNISQGISSQGNSTAPANTTNPQYQAAYQNLPKSSTNTPGLIGPIGYDIEK